MLLPAFGPGDYCNAIIMKRIGRVVKLREGAEADYERYHSEIWPKVLETIKKSGIKNYTIFRYDRWLFSYFELPAGITIAGVERVTSRCEACRRWEELMHKLQEPLPESGETFWWVPMNEVWHGED